MKQSAVRALLKDSGLSPEQLGRRMGISGMTLRRWAEAPADQELPKLYRHAVLEAAFDLAIEGQLDLESPAAKEIIGSDVPRYLSQGDGKRPRADTTALDVLKNLGSNAGCVDLVQKKTVFLRTFERVSRGWIEPLRHLKRVIKAKDLTQAEKAIAYGALFYLIFPFDLIPDGVPVFGLTDDFGMISLAIAYYRNQMAR